MLMRRLQDSLVLFFALNSSGLFRSNVPCTLSEGERPQRTAETTAILSALVSAFGALYDDVYNVDPTRCIVVYEIHPGWDSPWPRCVKTPYRRGSQSEVDCLPSTY